jgi:glucosamine-6-phosphate deaminase
MGFEQILPSKMRTGHPKDNKHGLTNGATSPPAIPRTIVVNSESPTILSPQPTTSRLLRPTVPASEYPLRSVSPERGGDRDDLVPDRMADRISGADSLGIRGRMTPLPELVAAPM